MNDIKEQALTKMLDEMLDGKGGSTEDKIHNWLCDQDDEELAVGIMKKGKTIAGAVKYCNSLARKEATNGSAMIDDDTVYGWIRDYFIKVVEKPKPAPKAKEKPKDKKKPKSKEKELSLDDLL